MIFSKKKLLNEFSIFFWLILVTLLGIIISTIYTTNKEEQSRQIKLSLDNTYLKKTFKEITRNLNPRITISKYTSKSGDTYQSIINNLNIENDEKKILLNSILKEKSLKILKINQKFTFKYEEDSNRLAVKGRTWGGDELFYMQCSSCGSAYLYASSGTQQFTMSVANGRFFTGGAATNTARMTTDTC